MNGSRTHPAAAALEFIQPPGWRRGRGYSYAVRAGGRIAISGVLAWDPASQTITKPDFASQWADALQNLRTVVEASGATMQTVSALRIYVTSLDSYREAGTSLGDSWKAVFGNHYPAITMVEVTRLVDDAALVEIEAEALAARRPAT